MAPAELVRVGRILRARGRRGELLAEIDSSQPGRAERLREVTLVLPERSLTATVEEIWHHQGRPVFKLAGIDSISQAEVWAGADIRVPASERIQPAEGEYFDADLIGCEVHAGGRLLGVVRSVENYGGGPLLAVDVEGREILIPFARAICREIDVAAKLIRAELPEGLVDL